MPKSPLGAIGLVLLVAWAAAPYILSEMETNSALTEEVVRRPAVQEPRQAAPAPPATALPSPTPNTRPAPAPTPAPRPMGIAAAFSDGGHAFDEYRSARRHVADLIFSYPYSMQDTCERWQEDFSRWSGNLFRTTVDSGLKDALGALVSYDAALLGRCARGEIAPGVFFLEMLEGDSIRAEGESLAALETLGVTWYRPLSEFVGVSDYERSQLTWGMMNIAGGVPTAPEVVSVSLISCSWLRPTGGFVPVGGQIIVSYNYALRGGLAYYLEYGPINARGVDAEAHAYTEMTRQNIEGGLDSEEIVFTLPSASIFVPPKDIGNISDRGSTVSVAVPRLTLRPSDCDVM